MFKLCNWIGLDGVSSSCVSFFFFFFLGGLLLFCWDVSVKQAESATSVMPVPYPVICCLLPMVLIWEKNPQRFAYSDCTLGIISILFCGVTILTYFDTLTKNEIATERFPVRTEIWLRMFKFTPIRIYPSSLGVKRKKTKAVSDAGMKTKRLALNRMCCGDFLRGSTQNSTCNEIRSGVHNCRCCYRRRRCYF